MFGPSPAFQGNSIKSNCNHIHLHPFSASRSTLFQLPTAAWECIFKIRIHITDYKFAACLSFHSFVHAAAAAAAAANFRLFYLFF